MAKHRPQSNLPEPATEDIPDVEGFADPNGPFFRRSDWVAFATTLIISLGAYTLTLAPTVTLEDSGELVVAADYLGVPHPPGYPIWTLLAWFFQWIFHFVEYYDQPNPAWAVGFMSAVFGALACACLALLVSRSGYDMLRAMSGITKVLGTKTESLLCWVGGVTGGLLLAFSSVLWSQSVIVEVYSLNAFFLSLILLLTYRWMCRPNESATLYLVAFLFGLGLTNHQTLLFALPALIFAIAFRDLKLFRDCLVGGFILIAIVLIHKAVKVSTGATEELQNQQMGFVYGAIALMAISGPVAFFASGSTASKWNRFFITAGSAIFSVLIAIVLLRNAAEIGKIDLEAQRQQMTFLLGALALVAIPGPIAFFTSGSVLTEWKRFCITAGLVILGVSFYLYLPIASDQNPPMNWGYPRTQEGFWHALSRGQYEKILVINNIRHAFANPDHFFLLLKATIFDFKGFTSVVSQFTWPMGIFVAIGFVGTGFMKWREVSWLLTTYVSFFCLTFVFMLFQYPDLDVQTLFIGRVQYIQSHALYALWISYGLIFLLAFIDTKLKGSPVVKYAGISLAFLLPLVLVSRNYFDEKFVAQCGGAEQNGHDFGWQFGNYQLRGIEGIREEIKDGEEPPPSETYPPEMDLDAIFFGGTDPGRFVPTYMIYSAKVREDVYLITQNALADNTYMAVMRDLYGDRIWIPSVDDSNNAFRKYVDDVRAGRIPPGAEVVEKDGRVSVQGVQGVMLINGILSKNIFAKNKHKHSFYIEESYVIPWMYPYLSPHGLIMKINKDPLPNIPAEIVANDHDFWEWYTNRLKNNPKFKRDVVARKTFSKLRSAIGGLYIFRRNYTEAEHAFKQAIALYDLSPEANFRLADAYVQQRKFDDAIAQIEEFLKKDEGNEKVRTYCNQLISTREKDLRRAELEDQLSKGADLTVAAELLGIYRDLGQASKFQNLANRILGDTRVPTDFLRKVGEISMKGRQWNLTQRAYQLMLERAPNDFSAWIELAAAQLASRKAEEGFKSLQKAVAAGGESARRILRSDSRFKAISNNKAFRQLVPPPAPQSRAFKLPNVN